MIWGRPNVITPRRGTFPGPKLSSCLTLRNELSEEIHVLTRKKILLGRSTRAESSGKGTQENCSAMWLTVLGFMVMGIVSGLSLINQSDSESFLVVPALLSQDEGQWEGFLDVVWHMVSPFDLSWTLPVGGGLWVPCSLPGPPVIKQQMQMVTVVPGQGGWFPCAFHKIIIIEIECMTYVACLNQPETTPLTPGSWKTCLSKNWSHMTKRLGTAALEFS